MPQDTITKKQSWWSTCASNIGIIAQLAKDAVSLASNGLATWKLIAVSNNFRCLRDLCRKTSTNTGFKPKHWVGLLGSTIMRKKCTSWAQESRLSQSHWWSPVTLMPGIIGEGSVKQGKQKMDENTDQGIAGLRKMLGPPLFSRHVRCRTFRVPLRWDSYTLNIS